MGGVFDIKLDFVFVKKMFLGVGLLEVYDLSSVINILGFFDCGFLGI